MRSIKTLLALSIISIVCVSTECRKCIKKDQYLEGTRVWLPLKGKTELIFKDSVGTEQIFRIHVIDTLQTYTNTDCADTYRSEKIEMSLYLNAAKSDSIYVLLGPPSSVCLHASSNQILYMSTCRFFITHDSKAMTALYNYSIGSRVYPEAKLFQANEGNDNSLDSIILGKNYGIVAFKYLNKHYSLK